MKLDGKKTDKIIKEANETNIPFSSNNIRLSGREWIIVAIICSALICLAPALWGRLEKFDPGVDYRLPYELGNDYWLYNRYCRWACSKYDTLVVGDSVIWGHYVSRDNTLSHYLNQYAGRDCFANLGVDGFHPAALGGLLRYYGRDIYGKNVIIQFNPLWMSSAKHDLQTDKEFHFNHPKLVPQFFPKIPCYKYSFSKRFSAVVERYVQFFSWTSHVRIVNFENMALPNWTIEHPYKNPLSAVTLELPAPKDNLQEGVSWTEKGIGQEDFQWVEPAHSLQWRFFRRTIDLLKKRNNTVFVVVGPFNEHMLKPDSYKTYQKMKSEIEIWLQRNNVAYCVPDVLGSELYRDASHPLGPGYAMLARQLFENQYFKSIGDTELNLKKKAQELAQKYMIIDTHLDVPYRLKKKMEDISERTAGGDFDYPRAKKGGLDVAFMAVYVPAEYEGTGNAYKFADETIDMIEGFARTWPDKFVMARSVADVKEQFGGDSISLALGIENGTCLEGNLANLEHFYDRGVRYITLAHSRANHICDSSFDPERKWHGLSPFGVKVVSEMNRLGMIIDVSHVSDDTFYQIIELSKAPVVATHSSCRHFIPGYERNMSDQMIKLLAKKGGVIQINFGSMFVSRRANQELAELKKSMDEYIETHNLEGREKADYIEQYMREHPLRKVHVSEVASHIEHVIGLVGIDYVGLGSDFDGVGDNLPEDLEDVSCYPNLICELLKKGCTEEDIRKICSENFLRVFSQVEKTARELQ